MLSDLLLQKATHSCLGPLSHRHQKCTVHKHELNNLSAYAFSLLPPYSEVSLDFNLTFCIPGLVRKITIN